MKKPVVREVLLTDILPAELVESCSPAYTTPMGAAFCGDSLQLMRAIPSGVVDLVMTSPPYALKRKKDYGNPSDDEYFGWFLPFAVEIHRILKDTGSFVLNIGGTWNTGSPTRSLYHFDVPRRLSGIFHLAQDFYWLNMARLPTPAEWVTVRRVRVKDAVELVWWFSKTPFPKADNRRVLRPYSESMITLLERGYKAKLRPSGHDISTKFQKDNNGAIAPNFLVLNNTESNSYYLRRCAEEGMKPHPARFPKLLPEFFIKLLSDRGDLVLDPFAGSNVTGEAAEDTGRRWMSIELDESYVKASAFRFERQHTDTFPLLEDEVPAKLSTGQTRDIPRTRQ
jgi:site-specific DNA-methyltransferase (cytosine-N4-specific)